MTTKTICGCGHPISDHTYSEDFTGCDQSKCKCNLDLGAYIDNLNAEAADAKARAKTAEENWHKNEARIAKLETTLQEMKTDLAQCFMELYDFSFPFADDISTKYFDTWQEIREAANRQ